jgi:tetratricopeptide (TPR) repeat protein
MSQLSMKEAVSLDSLVAQVADEFLERQRRGERPDPEENAGRHPEQAAVLREVLGALAVVGLSGPGPVAAGAEPASGVLGDFRILREVGRGGMGVVYEAEQVSLGRRVALKVLPFAATLDPRQLQRFHNEARAAASLDHPHIVKVHAVGQERGVHYYAMQFIDGQTLAAFIAQQRDGGAADQPTDVHPAAPAADTAPVAAAPTERAPRDRGSFRRAAEWGIQAAEALEHAHQLGVVHRDVKPANLMIDGRGKLWVADFGLARTAADGGLTLTGDLVGTLRYMSPEQALAQRGVIDHRTDVYSLGATLYELLTLQPAFDGADRQELLRQIAFEEPVRLRRLNQAIPAELETIVLKAMEKNPVDRYATAQELADDLRRWLEDQPIRARRPSWRQVAVKWARRHKPVVGAVAAVLLVVALVSGAAGLWWAQKWATTERLADAALREAEQLAGQSKWPEARAAAQRVDGLLEGQGHEGLRRRLRQLQADLTLVGLLDHIRLKAATIVDGKFDYASADRDYAQLFEERGLAVEGEDAGVVAARIQSSVIRAQLVAALDDWAIAARKRARRAWLLEVAQRAQPGQWSDRFRDPAVWNKAASLEQLAKEAKVGQLSPQLLTALGIVLRRTGLDPVPLWKAAQERHPADFWLNFALGNALEEAKPEEAIGYYRAALAVRPETTAVYNNLGNALYAKGKVEEAMKHWRQAIQLDPKLAGAHNNLGNALVAKGKVEEAMAHYRQAIALDPKYAHAHTNLGTALSAKGQVEEAMQHWRQAIQLDPKDAWAQTKLGNALKDKGKVEEAIQHYRQAIAIDPKHAQAHSNLGVALYGKGQMEEAIKHYRQAIALDPRYAKAHTGLGLALYAKGQVDEAIQHYRKVIALNPKYALAHTNLGVALVAKGQVGEAIKHYRKAIQLDPKDATAHTNLGAALAAKGETDELGVALQVKGERDEAIRAYRKALELDPKNAKAYSNLGNALAAKGQLDEAIQAHRKAIELGPKLAQSHTNLGAALAAKGQWDEAIAAYRQAIALDGKDAKAHTALGLALYAKGQLDEAIAAYRQAIALDGKDAKAHYSFGNALYAKGQVDEAIQHYRKVIALDPKHAQAHTNLGLALQVKGQLDEAIKLYRQAIGLNPKLAQAHGALGRVLLTQGQFAAAQAATRRCLDLLPPNHPMRKFVTQQLRQCAHLLALDEKLSAIRKGEAKPSGAAERIALAQLCQQYKQLYAASARFYAEAFADQPRLTEDLRAGHRYNAACAAARAAAGHGKDAPKLDDKQRPSLRRQALDWLRADLAAWTAVLEKAPPQGRLQVQRTLQHWQKDPDLAGVRDKDALAKLPDAERTAWRKLWADVEHTLVKAGGKKPQEKSNQKE